MIIIYHNHSKVVSLNIDDCSIINKINTLSIAGFLVAVAKEYPDEILVWCHASLKEYLNISEIENLFHHKKLLFSYNPFDNFFLDKRIGYVDESPFIKINTAVTFPTWQMSSLVGGIHSSVLLASRDSVVFENNLDYFLSSLAKRAMSKGLLCYSEPKLLKQPALLPPTKASVSILFRFVKQHYKTRWVFLLLLNFILHEKKLPLLPFLFSFFYKNRSSCLIDLDTIKLQSSLTVIDKATVDVIIPTIGRKEHLYTILVDLKSQSHLPINVIIVEQNSALGSESELDYLHNEEWPFIIKHTFTHQSGACNARNIALKQIISEWIFFADDDIRIGKNFLQTTLEEIKKLGVKTVSISCLRKEEKQIFKNIFQWGSFGAGCSFVAAASLKDCKFKMGYEFGFGEDSDFGMQLRNRGYDILFLPQPKILHLKAPIGGFRTKPVLEWHKDDIQPKPSPTVMLYIISHNSNEQLKGYKTTLFFKFYKHQKIKNPYRYFKMFQKQWDRSIFWANQLKKAA